METYILTQFIEEFESEAAKPDMNSDIGKVCKKFESKNNYFSSVYTDLTSSMKLQCFALPAKSAL